MTDLETPLWADDRVMLTGIEPDDSARIAAWWSDRPVVEANIPMPLAPQTVGDATFRLMQRHNDPDQWYWMIVARATGDRIGTVSLQLLDRLARVGRLGILIGRADYRGRGFGRSALSLMIRFGFNELDLQRQELNVLASNPAAIRLYERLGFQHEGVLRGAVYRDGHRIDWIQMGLLRDEWEANNDSVYAMDQ